MSESQPLHEGDEGPSCFMRNIKWISRSIGIITLIVGWCSMLVLLKDEEDTFVGYYLIPVNTFLTFFELTWVFNKMACCVKEGCCCRIWSAVMWVDNWKKFLLYFLLAIPLGLEGADQPLSIITGFLVTTTAVMYLLKSFYKPSKMAKPKPQVVVQKQPVIHTTEISTQTDVESGNHE